MSEERQRLHFACFWDAGPEFDVWAPRGVKLWAQVLRDLAADNVPEEGRFSWFGKISVSGGLGIPRTDIEQLDKIVKEQNDTGETHLYLWTHDKKNADAERSLHVGKVLEVSALKPGILDSRNIPQQFYENIIAKFEKKKPLGDLLPFWFKLKDLRLLDFDYHQKLKKLGPDLATDLGTFDPGDILSPILVSQKTTKRFFDHSELKETEWKGWWEEVLLGSGDWDPGQFGNRQLKTIYSEALDFARFNVPILILGPRGVGKTFLAWWIRNQSPFTKGKIRTDARPTGRNRFEDKDESDNQGAKFDFIGRDRSKWPQVACGSFPEETSLRSELFGHLKGSYTGAVTKRQGLLSILGGDTLFLDEIGDMPENVQRSLIKVIEEKEFRPLGSDKSVRSDFRLISATNVPLEKLRKRLHPDFFDRISTVRLSLPPLKEMRDDIPWLWRALYFKVKRDLGILKPERPLTKREEDRLIYLLQEQGLPGNLRDLLTVAQHVAARRKNSTLSPKDIIDKAISWRVTSVSEEPPLPNIFRAVALSFALGQSLDAVINTVDCLDLKEFEKEMKRYLADQVLTISRERGVAVDKVCTGKTERSLYDWKK